MKNIYDFIIIGAGISACTFASHLNKRFSDASILLIEHGRRIGGRATTRQSRKSKIIQFDHGLPSINFSKHTSQDIIKVISPLINSKKLVDISNDILLINECGILEHALISHKVYRMLPFMINFCEEIINQSINPKKIHFLFQTLTKSIKRTNNIWEIQVNNGRFIKSRNLILSSSLMAHPRCINVLQTNSLPIRDAFIPGEDKVVDSLLRETKKLTYIKRKIYILYVPKSTSVQNFNYKYLQVLFSNLLVEDLNFERIIFQTQSNRSMIIAIHCSYINDSFEINFENIMEIFKLHFKNYPKFLDLFLQARLIDKMDWRASQPLNHLLSKELQWSSNSNIGFCGDWFDVDSCEGVETAMNSSIRLAKLLNFK